MKTCRPSRPQEFFVTVLGLVGGAPGGQTPGVADAAGACRVFHTQAQASYVAGFPVPYFLVSYTSLGLTKTVVLAARG